jgi:hypothetical protein
MKKVAILVALLLAIAGCKSTRTKQIEEGKMVRVRLEPVPATEEMRAEIDALVQDLRMHSEVVYKDDLEGMKSTTVNRLVEIGQPAVGPLIESYYEALEDRKLVYHRYLVLAILQRMRERSSQDFLVQVLHRGDRKERRMAAEALWWFGDTACVSDLIHALDDDSLDVVNTVAAALRAITGFSFGIYRSISVSQREEAIKRWRQWWSVTGSAFPRGRADQF